ncbi:MAG: rod shape-determining protein MreC [Maribacter sp.]|jgi:rod shape-determining protein MreC
MQNLIQLLVRFNAVFLFLILQVVCFILIINFNNEQGAIYTATTNAFSGKLYDARDQITKHFSFERENNKLAEDNALLFAELEVSQFNNIIETDTVSNADYMQQYTYTSAHVINNSSNKASNYMTINRGRKHGIKPHNGVIGGKGIVGIVLGVSERYATIMSLLHQQTKISVTIKNKGYFGSMVWSGKESSHMSVEAIPRHAIIAKGDTVVTNGYSSKFPGGIMVGLVDNIEGISGSSFHKIDVKLSEDLNKVEHVYVVDNLFQQEQNEIEEELENE